MKKLSFIALATVLSVGAATLSANAVTAWRITGEQVECDQGDITCADAFPNETLYQTNPQAGPAEEVDQSTYLLGFND